MKVTSLMAEYDGEEYIIANLDKKHLNEQLDLAFSVGEKMAFKVSIVYLLFTGVYCNSSFGFS